MPTYGETSRRHLTVFSNIDNQRRKRVPKGTRFSYFFGILLTDKMCMLDTIRAKRGELYRIADRNKADKLYVFGSCARQEESEDSDVDFLVRFRKDASLLDQVGIANEFRDFLGRQVDVVSTGSLRRAPRFAHQVLSDYVAI